MFGDMHIVKNLTKDFPAITGIKWFNLSVLLITPALSLYGLLRVPILPENDHMRYMLLYLLHARHLYWPSSTGYHRLWSHRSYVASFPLQVALILAGASAAQGSCFWWARRHRSHHRHTDTDLDPNDPLVQWQHRWYFAIMAIFGYTLPMCIPGFLWGDWKGGFYFVGALRMTACHHSTFCINSIAHYLGSTPYDDKHSPRDHFISAILTMGEGYHNFHHQFPMDYRNAFRWYQYDPTKWFIAACQHLHLASHLRALKVVQDSLVWPVPSDELPVVTWESFQEESKSRTLLLVSGFIHDASLFVVNHPGGPALLTQNNGKDVTAAFFGGIYSHSHAAHNLLAMMRVGILAGGVEVPAEHSIPPSQRLVICSTPTNKSDLKADDRQQVLEEEKT
ncbi:hypothetical protein BU15DRAFT_87767 [Melanogaster broomeanus]|nr:hypothetical protein BU15DRAFT_87767 [Melanogaster broomeanus]